MEMMFLKKQILSFLKTVLTSESTKNKNGNNSHIWMTFFSMLTYSTCLSIVRSNLSSEVLADFQVCKCSH